jgi:hypothetical protein
VSELLASGSTDAACESALSKLVPAARDHLDQHRSMTPSVPNTLWACGNAAFSTGLLDLAAPLCLASRIHAVIVDGLDLGGPRC